MDNENRKLGVVTPEESGIIISFEDNGKPGIGSLNTSLITFEPKVVFAWHCSIVVELRDVSDVGFPLDSERAVINAMEERFVVIVVGSDAAKPNALFLASLAWDGNYEFVWRVYDPGPVAQQLQATIDDETYLRPFHYRISPDEKWELAKWHLEVGRAD